MPAPAGESHRSPLRVTRDFFRKAFDDNLTGLSGMVAYNLLLSVFPLALLALFIAGRVLESPELERSVLEDLRGIFPNITDVTLTKALDRVRGSSTGVGVVALVTSVYIGSSFWGAMDTAFCRIYHVRCRGWVEQKRFSLAMLVVVLLFMAATVAVPTLQSVLAQGAGGLPFGLSEVDGLLFALSLFVGLLLVFGVLCVIYWAVPNRLVPWRAISPGAVAATVAIGLVDYGFPLYLSTISTIGAFTTIFVFVLIVLVWLMVYNGPAKSEASIRTAIREGLLALNANSVGEAALITRLAAEEQRTVRLGIRLAVPGDVGRAVRHRRCRRGGRRGSRCPRRPVGRAGERPRPPRRHDASRHRAGRGRCQRAPALRRGLGADRVASGAARRRWQPRLSDVVTLPHARVPPQPGVGDRPAAARSGRLPHPSRCRRPGRLSRRDARTAAGLADAATVARAWPGDDRRHAAAADEGCRRQGRRNGLDHAVLDAGVNVAEAVRSEYHQLFSVSAPSASPTTAYRLAGPICTPGDVLYNHWRLPALEPGHVLAIMDTGAYFVPFSTTFSFAKPAIVMLDGDDVSVARRREEFADVIALDELSADDGRAPSR